MDADGADGHGTTTLGDYSIRQGADLMVAPYVLHRNPTIFPEPERFDPERFTAEREKELPRYAYIPFGAGPRVCIGNSFAMMEAQLIIATVAQRFRLRLAADQRVEMNAQITLSPLDGLRMVVEERARNSQRQPHLTAELAY
ncbi:MAG: cytochrome P450 [Chloroflexi bacterium]|nr:cytochrome P450 [Chloroflexota bacterium]